MSPKTKQKSRYGSRRYTAKRSNDKQSTSRPASDSKKRDESERTHREKKKGDNKSDVKQSKSQEKIRNGSKDSRKDSTSSSRRDRVQSSSDVRMEHRRSRSRDREGRSSQSQLHIRDRRRDNSEGPLDNVSKGDNKCDVKQNKSQEMMRSGSKDSRENSTSSSRWDSVQPSSDMKMEHRRSHSKDGEDCSSQSQLHIIDHHRDNSSDLQDYVPKVCRDFIHNQCSKGADCPRYHPPIDIGGSQEQHVPWFAICHNHLLDGCDRMCCSFFHISKEDEEMYRRRGEISPQVVDRAVHKSLVQSHSLIGAQHYCKAFLYGQCTVPNCQLRHLSKWEYADVIFYELLDEFQYLFGTPESGSIPVLDSINSSNPLMSGNPDDMMAVKDESGHIKPPPFDLEPERKRMRYSSGDPGFVVEDKRWDDSIDDELSRDRNVGTSRFMEEIVLLRNDNMELSRKAEMKIEKLREELSKLAQANSKLCTDSNRRSDKYNAEIQILISAKTTLAEEKRGLQKTVQELEDKVGELQKAVDETEEKKRALVQMMVQRNVELTKNLTKEAEKSEETVQELEKKTAKLQDALTLERRKAQQALKELERKNAELQKSLTLERQKSEEVLKELESKNKKMRDTVDQKVKEAVKRYEEENRELRKTIDSRTKATGSEIKKKLEVTEKKLVDSRDSFSRMDDLLRESEHRRSQVEMENEELRKKMHRMHDEFTAWKKMQEISNKPGYRPRNVEGYSRNEDYQGGWRKEDNGRLGQQGWNRPGGAREEDIRPMDLLRRSIRKSDTTDIGGLVYSNLGYSRRGESTHGKSPSPRKELNDTIDLNIRRPETSRDFESSGMSKILMDYLHMSSAESSHNNTIKPSPQGHQELPKAMGNAACFHAAAPLPIVKK